MRNLVFLSILGNALALFGWGSPEKKETDGSCSNPNKDGTCPSDLGGKYHPVCGLYMAPSSIPHAGWGMYTNQDIAEGDAIDPLDVSIAVVDFKQHQNINEELLVGYKNLPSWLMHEYYWNADVIYSQFEADSVDGVVPGFGMLANSHVGLINMENTGAQNRVGKYRDGPSVGASSEYQDITFRALDDIPAGHELFAEYGDEWFRERTYAFGDALPLSYHFEEADTLLADWNRSLAGDLKTKVAEDLYSVVLDGFSDMFSKRLLSALPSNFAEAKEQFLGKGTAYATVPNVIRDQEWLENNGMCLDHITHGNSDEVPGERGAFSTRRLPKGSLVAPAPLIHLSRKHMDMTLHDRYDEVLWRGHQLLLNYCYGHKSTSLIFFPYSPATNLINHGGKKKANVGIRWSETQPKPELLNWTANEVLEFNKKSGLAMEIYALRDIDPGEEVLLDYGENWQEAWDRHAFDWTPPVHSGEKYKSAWDYDIDPHIATHNESDYPPPMVQVRCHVVFDKPGVKDADGWYEWKEPKDLHLDNSSPCVVLNRRPKGNKVVFDVKVRNSKKYRNVPFDKITFVDEEYTTNLHLRNAFRHEIELPDEMIPDSWKDLEVPPGNEKCGLYMATSSIPNAGLGMFTGRDLEEGEKVCGGDVSIQVEDYELNVKLRHWSKGEVKYEEPTWLIHNYFWNPTVTHAVFEADDVQSIIPGMGMLANSHTVLYNSAMETAIQTTDLHRGRDPGAGASTNYHDVHFYAEKDLPAGHELFVSYGDTWFEDREELGPIPLSFHFEQADKTLKKFLNLTNGSVDSELAVDLWDIIVNASATPKRFNSAFPKKVEDVPMYAKDGAAPHSLPDRVRSIDWLQENGICLDNIRIGPSNFRQAGKGAFTTRAILKGDIIVPMPVVHLRRHSMEIFNSDDFDDPSAKSYLEGHQQLLNYCFGHSNSSLLLYPYSPMSNYVNHNASLANAELRWSSLPNHLNSWLERSPADLDVETHSGMIMDMVATRDIAPGEEVYLDYGEAWESAWKQHVDKFNPSRSEKRYVSAAQLNKRMEWLRTMKELKNGDKYNFDFDDVRTICYVGKKYKGAKKDQEVKSFKWKYSENIYSSADFGFPCDILERNSPNKKLANDRRDAAGPPLITTSYTVMVFGDSGRYKMTNVPRKAIFFRDAKYQSDFAYRTGFRHEMHIPDAMFPEAWLDLKS